MAEVKDRFEVAGIESKRGFVGLDRTRNVAGTLESMAKQKTRSALRREQIDGSTQRRHGCRGIFFRQQDAQIEESLGHFRIQHGGTFVFGASLAGPLEGGVGVAELEVGPGNIGFFSNNLFKSSDSGFELIVVNVVLRFVEEIVKRIGDFLSSSLGGLFGGGLREESRRGGRERRDASCSTRSAAMITMRRGKAATKSNGNASWFGGGIPCSVGDCTRRHCRTWMLRWTSALPGRRH